MTLTHPFSRGANVLGGKGMVLVSDLTGGPVPGGCRQPEAAGPELQPLPLGNPLLGNSRLATHECSKRELGSKREKKERSRGHNDIKQQQEEEAETRKPQEFGVGVLWIAIIESSIS